MRTDEDVTAALELTDTLDLESQPVAGDPSVTAALRDPLLDMNLTAGMRLLVDIARAHRAFAPEEAPPARPLFQWGHLQVVRLLGQGSYGEVYAAWDPQLRREVALKLARVRAGTLRWIDEARSLARVRHPNVLTIHGADLRDERAGLWTELVGGRTLEQALAEDGVFNAAVVCRIGRDLAAALSAVHAAGLVHGDLKTANVMIEDDRAAAGTTSDPQAASAGRVVLMDFGTASLMTSSEEPGTRVTTPLFAAPEVLSGAAPNPRSDVYSLGVVLYRLHTARMPVTAATFEQLIAAHQRGGREPLPNLGPGLPQRLVKVIERAIAPDPGDRFASAGEMRDALARLLGERRPRIAPLHLALTIGAAAVAVILFVVLARQFAMRDTDRVAHPPPPTAPLAGRAWWVSPPQPIIGSLGWNLSAADFDHDHRADLLLSDGAYSQAELSQGRALLYRGAAATGSVARTWTFAGHRSNDQIGGFVTRAGDVNGDGFEDALIQDPTNTQGGRVATGAVLLFLGSPGGLGAAPAQVMSGDVPGAGFAHHLAPAGDVNGDGYDDVLVSEHNWSGEHRNQGRVHVYLGGRDGLPSRPSQILIGEAMNSAFGWNETGVGDLNHDGFDDVVVGAAWWRDRRGELGAMYVYLGGPRGLSAMPSGRIIGDRDGDLMGNAAAAAGDVNGDGYGDVAVGVAGHDGAGANVGEVRIYLGTRNGLDSHPAWRSEGYGSQCNLGFSVAPARDVDGDGLPDLLVGGYGFSTDASHPSRGAVFLYRGAGPKRLFERRPGWWVAEPQTEALFGASVDLADIDGDGLADIVAGSPHWRNGSVNNGRVSVYRGARGRAPQR